MDHTFARHIASYLDVARRRYRSIRRRSSTSFASRLPAPPSVTYVDDPHDHVRLVRARGPIGPTSIEHLFRAWADLTAPHLVHVDVSDAWIRDISTMLRLEAALDQLERRRIAVRVVGIDPQHPALTH